MTIISAAKTAIAPLLLSMLFFAGSSWGHHVLGRPAYSLNEASNTPPSMAIETQLGDYFITYMLFPAFPLAGEQGRLNLYANRIDNGQIFNGEVEFRVRDNSWFTNKQEFLGRQVIDDGVYRQGFIFAQDGAYIVSASFMVDAVPYVIDFPLQIGKSSPIGVVVAAVLFVLVLLLGVNVIYRKRLQRSKILQAKS